MSRFFSLFLAIALLLGQGEYLTHKYEHGFYAHRSGDLSYKSLKSIPINDAIMGTEMLAVPVAVGQSKFYIPDIRVATVMDIVYQSRAPPAVSPA